MCYRFTILCLIADFIAPALLESAPAPRQIYPDVYALVYVGKGKNDRKNTQRIADACAEIASCPHSVWQDPEVQKLSIAGEKKPKELSDWMKKKIRVGTLEGTSFLRVWMAEGTPEEQAVIVNATLRRYLRDIEERRQHIGEMKEHFRRIATQGGVIDNANVQKELQTFEEEINMLPRLLEWAAVKDKH